MTVRNKRMTGALIVVGAYVATDIVRGLVTVIRDERRKRKAQRIAQLEATMNERVSKIGVTE